MNSLSKFRTPNTSKAMGIEIECYMSDSTYSSYDVRGEHHGFFYGTTDGSIECSWRYFGIEFVSQPLSAAWLKKEIAKLARKFTWEANSSCGVHIHVSRKWLSLDKARSINTFLSGLSWDEQEELFGRMANHYCRYSAALEKEDRYCAINITNKDTIEFRMFKSGDAAWCRYCVDMVEYLINNSRTLNVDAAMAFKDMYGNAS